MSGLPWFAGPILLAAAWCALCWFFSVASGWRALATQFRARQPPSGRCFAMQRARINGVQFNGFLFFTVGPEGLHMKVLAPFAIGTPPLLIPWSALSPLHYERWHWFDTHTTKAQTARFGRVSITLLDRDITRALAEYLPHEATPVR